MYALGAFGLTVGPFGNGSDPALRCHDQGARETRADSQKFIALAALDTAKSLVRLW